MSIRTCIAIINEKGGTAKTTTSVNLAAALGEQGQRVLLVDLDGQAASSRWVGVEEDNRLAEAMGRGGGLKPIPDVMPNVSLVPASGKLDSVAHDLRPTQGGQLRRILAEISDDYDYILIDCPPSLGNRLIANGLLAATHVIVPVETSILALDGLKILLTTLEDVRDGFGHDIVLAGVLACRYDGRTKLSRLVLEELRRALPGRVFNTLIRENVRMRECPASGQSILAFAPDSPGAADYRALATELLAQPQAWREAVTQQSGQHSVENLRNNAAAVVRESARKNAGKGGEEELPPGETPEHTTYAAPDKPAAAAASVAPADVQAAPISWADVLAQKASEPQVAPAQDGDTPGDSHTVAIQADAGEQSVAVPCQATSADEPADEQAPWASGSSESTAAQTQAADEPRPAEGTLALEMWLAKLAEAEHRLHDEVADDVPPQDPTTQDDDTPREQSSESDMVTIGGPATPPEDHSGADVTCNFAFDMKTETVGETPATQDLGETLGTQDTGDALVTQDTSEAPQETSNASIGLAASQTPGIESTWPAVEPTASENRDIIADEAPATQETADQTLAPQETISEAPASPSTPQVAFGSTQPASAPGGDDFPALRAYLKQMQQEGRMPVKPAPAPQEHKKSGFRTLFRKVVGSK